MAKKNFLYPAEWVKNKPYTTVDNVDIYYTGIANRIYDILKETKLDSVFAEPDNLRIVTMSIAGWFEDVISQNGIWQTFTTECEKTYGRRLPFYDTGNSYYPDEINIEDVKFLLWHNLQSVTRTQRLINPKSPVLALTAEFIYHMLEDEYETAPENERLHEFIYGAVSEEESCQHYVSVASWFHYKSFFNIENYDEFLAINGNFLDNANDTPEQIEAVSWGMYVTIMLKGRRSLMALTTPKWLARLAKGHDTLKAWTDVKVRKASCYMVEAIADGVLTLADLVEGGKITVSADNLDFPTKDFVPGTTTLICEFINYNKQLHRIGTIAINDMGESVTNYVEQEKAARSDKNQKAIYKEFTKAADGNYVMFFENKAECEKFLTDNIGYTFAQGVKLPEFKTDRNIMLMVSPQTGLTIQPGFLSCLNTPRNPYYRKEEAEKNALSVIARANAIAYDVMCRMQDEGMFADAMYSGCDTPEEGKQLAQDNLQFLTDYYYHNNRKSFEKVKY